MRCRKKILLVLALVAAVPFVLALRSVRRGDDEIPFYGATAPAAAHRGDAFAASTSLPADAAHAIATQLQRGQFVYEMMCQPCHMPDGRGMAGTLPPLAGADFMLADRERATRVVLQGLAGEIVVNGASFNSAMPALGAMLSDQQVADVLTFVFNTWGNTGAPFSAADVRRLR